MIGRASGALLALLLCGRAAAGAQIVALSGAAASGGLSEPEVGLRTFTIDKPPGERPGASDSQDARDRDLRAARDVRVPTSQETLQTTLGVGFVQQADWGAEIASSGAISSMLVSLDALATHGAFGTQLTRGALSLSRPDSGWQFEAGDVFSPLAGASRGARVTWRMFGGRQPSFAVYTSLPGLPAKPTVAVYRDQIRVFGQTLLDAEVASDRSHFLRSRLSSHGVGLEVGYRDVRAPVREIDRSLSLSAAIGRAASVSGSVLGLTRDGVSQQWRQIIVHVPLSRNIDVAFDRSFASSGATVDVTSGIMVGLTAGDLHVFHRYQYGATDVPSADGPINVERQQMQSFAEYRRGPRLQLTLQLATEWTASGVPRTWEELESTIALTRGTLFQSTMAVPSLLDPQRLHVRLTQALPARFSIVAEYGRLSSFQEVLDPVDRPRFSVMLRKTWNLHTPSPGGELRGRVMDQTGQPVAGALVRLGPYAMESGADGTYAFTHVPGADYDLALDDTLLPADYAWDGVRVPLSIARATREHRDLVVAPLNAIHGRVFCDRNGNGRFDEGEGVAGVVVQLGGRATVTDPGGSYSFYNVEPGTYAIALKRGSLPQAYAPVGDGAIDVTLGDDRPVTNADLRLAAVTKPVIWQEVGR